MKNLSSKNKSIKIPQNQKNNFFSKKQISTTDSDGNLNLSTESNANGV